MNNFDQFLKYILSGGTATIVHLVTLWLGVEIFNFSELLSSFIGFSLATVINYYIQHTFVFQKDGSHSLFFKKYFIITILMQTVNIVIFGVLITFIDMQYVIAQIVTIGFIFICNFIINSKYTFA